MAPDTTVMARRCLLEGDTHKFVSFISRFPSQCDMGESLILSEIYLRQNARVQSEDNTVASAVSLHLSWEPGDEFSSSGSHGASTAAH